MRQSQNPLTLGRYSLHGEIAAGGMAVVHFARMMGPAGFARTVAIKRMHAHMAKDPGFRAMFLDEARLAARIRHPNVVPVLDVVDEDDDLYLVLEYVHGESLDQLMRGAGKRKQVVPMAVVASVIRDVLHGLHAAHDAKSERGKPLGIVHRDVSPHNVLVGTDGLARVVDFGVAKAQARMQLTAEGQLKGKIAYMAPEQVDHQDVDRRADVWSTAVVAWEALTGKRLFVADHPAQLIKRVLSAPVPNPRELDPDLPPALADVVMRGLQRDRDARFGTALEMAVALENSLSVAPKHEVGAWVEGAAAKALAERAEIITEIEGGATLSNAQLVLPSRASTPPASANRASSPPTTADRSSSPPAEGQTLVATSLTNAETRYAPLSHPPAGPDRATSGAALDGKRRWSTLLIAALAAAAGASIAVLLGAGARPAGDGVPKMERVTVSAWPLLQRDPRSATPPEAKAAASAPAPSASAPPAAKHGAKGPLSGSRHVLPATKGTGKTRADCDPPWTKDASGVQIPKLHCL